MKTTRRWAWIGVVLALVGCGDVTVGNDQRGGLGQPPARPKASTSDVSDTGELTFALDDFQLNQTQNSAWKDIGFDLDGYATSSDGTPAECMESSQSPDGHDGVDNRFAEMLWPVIQSSLPSLQCELDWAHARGHGTWLLRIFNWNGLADDAYVTAKLVRAIDGTTDASADCAQLDAAGELVDGSGTVELPPPAWSGNDRFCVNPDSLAGGIPGGAPLIADAQAYVAGGSLVMAIPESAAMPLVTTRSNLTLRLAQGVLVAAMDAGFTQITRGVVAGRFGITQLTNVGPDVGVCDLTQLSDSYQNFPDIMATPPSLANPDQACNALSIGLAFQGIAATVAGTASTAVPPPQLCDMAGPSGMIVVPYPVDACCDYLNGSEPTACHAYWASMP